MSRINVTKTFIPPLEKYEAYLPKIWESSQLTNHGPLVREFELKTKSYLEVDNFNFVANGTLALQLCLRALGCEGGEIITTPFSYVATTSAILWEGFKPVFVDIDPETLCIDPLKIESAITSETRAILAVHVFGNPCDIDSLAKISEKHDLPLIYDGAHAFGTRYKHKSLLAYGDMSACSFHATKLFHTAEGGCVITHNPKLAEKLELMRRFGHQGDIHHMLGINAKASELHAAMGLCNLEYIDSIIEKRGNAIRMYEKYLNGKLKRPTIRKETEYNNAYLPIIFDGEIALTEKLKKLNEKDIFPRRYFYPSLNSLPYLADRQECPISEDISKRVLCLPLYPDLPNEIIEDICECLIF